MAAASSGEPAPVAAPAPESPPPEDASPVETHRGREKVEIPASVAQLEPGLEAEIEAALSGAGSLAIAGEPVENGFAAQPAAPHAPAEEELRPGLKLRGKVLSIYGENIILDLGTRASGILQTRQFDAGKLPVIGTLIDVVIERYQPAEGLIYLQPPRAVVTKPAGNWHEIAEGQVVDCMVVKSNKGGLEVSISNLRGFLPASQVELGFVSDTAQYVGQKLRVKITEVNPHKKNLIVSRRAFLEIARAEAREDLWKRLEVGQTHAGTVKTLKDYGAFVDIGGVDGLLHVADLSWNRVNHPRDVLAEGQQVEVQILALDREKSKVSLGMRQLTVNPWHDVAERYSPSQVVHGRVTRTSEFGAFVELEPGVEGLVHISELDHRRVHRVTDVLQVGQEIDVQVLSIDLDKKRISLSLKALIAKPEAAPKKSDEDHAPSGGAGYERKRKGPLKGGGTGSGGGLLFGTPH